MRSIVLSAVLLSLTSFGAGCSSGDAPSSASSSAATAVSSTESFCEAYCTKTSACDSSNDVQTCTAECTDTINTTINKLRTDLVGEIRSCWDASDCRQVLSGTRLGDCVDEATVSAAPQASAKAFCDSLNSGLQKCDSGLDRADCLEFAKVYSDESLQRASKCASKACSAIMDCVNATL